MNFLAHLYLSGDDDQIKIGNFSADFIKGRKTDGFPDQVKKGIRLHRTIDNYTDSHPIFLKGRERVKSKYHLYSGVVIDILYDHFLAINWAKYSDVELKRYIRDTYVIFVANFNILPPRVKKILPVFIVRNWIAEYPHIDGIKRVLERMSQRTTLPPETDFAIEIMKNYYSEFNEEFSIFFDDMIAHVNRWKAENDL